MERVHRYRLNLAGSIFLLIRAVIKQNRVTEISTENDLPIVALVQSVLDAISHSDAACLSHNYRPESFYRNSFGSSIKGVNCSVTWPCGAEKGSRHALLYSDLPQRAVPIIPLSLTIPFSLRVRLRYFWLDHHSSKWRLARSSGRRSLGARGSTGQSRVLPIRLR